VQEFFDAEIKKLKLKPYYFPLFVTEDVLQKEKDHIEGFAPEVWAFSSCPLNSVTVCILPVSILA
jgi:prolyl-tRNA synthetase